MTAAKNAPITRRAFRFRRVRLETLDVVLESKPGDVGHALALIQASRIAGLKRTVWQPDNEPYRTFLEASVEETSRPSVRSEIERELRQRTYGKSYIVMELDRDTGRGDVHWLGNRIRRSKKIDVSIAVDLITALMKAARIVEIIDTDQTRHENPP